MTIRFTSLYITIILFVLVFPNDTFAQAPAKINYSIIIRDNKHNPVLSSKVFIKISILQSSETGTEIYTESFSSKTNANGLASVMIGSGSTIKGNFASINWATGTYYVKTEANAQGESFIFSTTEQLLSVPYALYATSTIDQNGFTHYVGELFGGGIVVSVWKANGVETGLIVSLDDISSSATWSNVDDRIGANADNFTYGKSNSTAILNQSGHTSSAALLCKNYSGGGFTDWYLPADAELLKCYDVATVINSVLGNDNLKIASSLESDYWSSTESLVMGRKNEYRKVRAVRRF